MPGIASVLLFSLLLELFRPNPRTSY